jgi:hypothetical protein
MAVLSLVLGIVSIAIFSWLGPVIGAAVGAPSAEQLMSGTGTFSSGPAYGIAVFISIILPIISLVFGIMGLKKKKGVSIAGIITSAFGLLLGIILTVVIVGGASAAMSLAQGGLSSLNDPAAQKQLQDALNQAMQGAQQAAPPAPPAQ